MPSDMSAKKRSAGTGNSLRSIGKTYSSGGNVNVRYNPLIPLTERPSVRIPQFRADSVNSPNDPSFYFLSGRPDICVVADSLDYLRENHSRTRLNVKFTPPTLFVVV